MGKPYESEISRLPESYGWVIAEDVSVLESMSTIRNSLSLVSVGSGGSLTAAHFLAYLHRSYSQTLALPTTPLDLVRTYSRTPQRSVWFLSASGSNPDITKSYEFIARREPEQLVVMVGKSGSKLASIAHSRRWVDTFEFDPPAGKDGFLATNSLLTFCALLVKAESARTGVAIPTTLSGLLEIEGDSSAYYKDIQDLCSPLWQRDTTVLLHGSSTSSGAFDIESKFSESGIGNIRMADFRNFGHGRHQWIAEHPETTSVLAITSPEDEELSKRTLNAIPDSIPKANIMIPHDGVLGQLASIVASLYVVGSAGSAKNIDPGQPHVPAFGRRLYRLSPRTMKDPQGGNVAIERKIGHSIGSSDESFWQLAHRDFVSRIRNSGIKGLVLDYDGTLVDRKDRSLGPIDDISTELKRLLTEGMPIGVATGRGQSVREDLRRVIPKRYWNHLIIGYYNCSEIGDLSESKVPDTSGNLIARLLPLLEEIRSLPIVSAHTEITIRQRQITIEIDNHVSPSTIWRDISRAVDRHSALGAQVVRSAHSVDILDKDVDKRTMFQTMRNRFQSDFGPEEVLAIGDRGAWPGNDHNLLSSPLSLSVDQVSDDPSTCWNLSRPGLRGADATVAYLRSLKFVRRNKSWSLRIRKDGLI